MFLEQGWNPASLHWEHGVLTPGPPGNFLSPSFLIFIINFIFLSFHTVQASRMSKTTMDILSLLLVLGGKLSGFHHLWWCQLSVFYRWPLSGWGNSLFLFAKISTWIECWILSDASSAGVEKNGHSIFLSWVNEVKPIHRFSGVKPNLSFLALAILCGHDVQSLGSNLLMFCERFLHLYFLIIYF